MRKQNKDEAAKLIKDAVKEYEQLSYAELCKWVEGKKVETRTIKGLSGVTYQVEFLAFWDDKSNSVIRFSGSIYDDSQGWFMKIKTPVSYDFLKEKDQLNG